MMTDDETADNVVCFATFSPRKRVTRIERDDDGNFVPKEMPNLFVDLHLGDDFSIEMRLHDSTGVVGTLKYGLTVKSPEDFDLDVLREAWARWREADEVINEVIA